ncbi:hypothetical protein J1G44_08000 [Cellulomonas sp. zg-ZUI199]|uniref:Uncharacterized protein n=1 Tax=Cellulomonas wangleii TaxID=2816956 RepID=A0ABX8D4R4_9CELL|nr:MULTISPECIES: hypothetical protein [Cellulomonas]MBO0898575.1 hypothetical protein [Cellulomonas sp. zg-ZUI22]MBO0924423.1 hypothetical protein [Cellulomonas wangleii]QVI62419.1 hypothetical protein KG103_00180 [Cellulomonas wangleii]
MPTMSGHLPAPATGARPVSPGGHVTSATMLGHTVLLDHAVPEVDALLRAELGAYFGIDAQLPEPLVPLARVSVEVSAEAGDRWRTSRGDAGRPILLHSGSHAYDVRRGVRHEHDGVVVVESVDTGSCVVSDVAARTVHVVNGDPAAAASDVRRVVRDLLFLPWLEAHGGVVVHAAAVVGADGSGTLVVGDRGAGKTSVFMAAALDGAREALSCERIVLLPTPDGLRMLACPEKISTFPGTLRAFPQTEHLAGPRSADTEWSRPGKRRIAWQDMFACLGFTPAQRPVYLDRVVFPTWEPAGRPARRLDRTQTWFRLLDQTVTGRSVERPDWLGWFAPAHTDETLWAASAAPAWAATWSDLDSAAALTRGALDD